MHLCRLGGIPLALHWSFLVLVAYLTWEGWRVGGLPGLVWVFGYTVAVFACVVLHELGHALTARRFGVGVPRILLLPVGGMAEFDHIPRRPRHELLIALAGPAVNAVLAGALVAAGVRIPTGWDALIFPLTLTEFFRHLVVMNVVMGLFNLLPIFPMDGGRVLRALLALRWPYVRATLVAASVGKVLALAGIGIMLLGFESPHWLGTALFAFIFLAGEMEYRFARQREIDETRWRETVARFYRDVGRPVDVTLETPESPEVRDLK